MLMKLNHNPRFMGSNLTPFVMGLLTRAKQVLRPFLAGTTSMWNCMLRTNLSFFVQMVSLQHARASHMDLDLHTAMMAHTHSHSHRLLVAHWLLVHGLLHRLLVNWLLISHRLLITHLLLLWEAKLLLTHRLLHRHATHADNDRWLMMANRDLGRDFKPVKEYVRVALNIVDCNLVCFSTSVEVEPVVWDVFLTNSSSVVLAFDVLVFDQLVMINVDIDFARGLFPACKHLSCQEHLIVVGLNAGRKCKLQVELRLM